MTHRLLEIAIDNQAPSLALLKKLEAEYPARCMQIGETIEQHMFYAGKVDLIRRLRFDYEKHQELIKAQGDTLTGEAEAVQARGGPEGPRRPDRPDAPFTIHDK